MNVTTILILVDALSTLVLKLIDAAQADPTLTPEQLAELRAKKNEMVRRVLELPILDV